MVLDARRNWIRRQHCGLSIHHHVYRYLLLPVLVACFGVYDELREPHDWGAVFVCGRILVLEEGSL